MPNERRLNGLAADVERLKQLLDDVRELLHATAGRVAALEDELRRRRLSTMHEAKQ